MIAVLLAAVPGLALGQMDRGHVLGAGVQFAHPYDEFGRSADNGWGLNVVLDYPLVPLFHACALAGRTRFAGDGDLPGITVWEVSAGGRLAFGAFYMGGEVGWYDRGDVWSWVPSMGVRLTRLEFAWRLRAVSRSAYSSLGVAWYF